MPTLQEKYLKRLEGRKPSKKSYEMFDKMESLKTKPLHNRKKPIFQYTKDDVFVYEHPSVSQASFSVNRSVSALSMHLRGHSKLCAGFIWRYK